MGGVLKQSMHGANTSSLLQLMWRTSRASWLVFASVLPISIYAFFNWELDISLIIVAMIATAALIVFMMQNSHDQKYRIVMNDHLWVGFFNKSSGVTAACALIFGWSYTYSVTTLFQSGSEMVQNWVALFDPSAQYFNSFFQRGQRFVGAGADDGYASVISHVLFVRRITLFALFIIFFFLIRPLQDGLKEKLAASGSKMRIAIAKWCTLFIYAGVLLVAGGVEFEVVHDHFDADSVLWMYELLYIIQIISTYSFVLAFLILITAIKAVIPAK